LDDLAERLRRFGLATRLAIADTAGASWAMARHGSGDRIIIRPGAQAEALADQPISALRLCADAQSLLLRLGFRRIRQLLEQPRAPFAVRFEGDLLLRLDQALGREPEPLVSVAPPPCYRVQATFLEPIVSQEHIVEGAARLLRQLAATLAQDDVGARVLRLLLFRVDGHVLSLDLGLASPSRDAAHLARLISLRLERLGRGLDAAFGFEAAAVHVLVAEPLPARQAVLAMTEAQAEPDGLARLIDRLQQRLGSQALRQLHAKQSHIPECAEEARPAGAFGKGAADAAHAPDAAGEDGPTASRPMLLLAQPEPAQIIALLPEGPPRQFHWRGVTHQVTGAEGPERIMPEWWRSTEAERDYYVVEDTEGRRFWLYREGLYGGACVPKWFVHGMFA